MVILSSVPEISISLAPPQDPLVEPFSPFYSTGPISLGDSDSFRPSLLTPPPSISPRFPRQLSPLRPSDAPVTGQGIERERFEELLRASKERNSALGSKKSLDLRKEIAIKAHKSKQVERRALFLSKVHAPPSPGATLLPKTPPESPAIFHYSLPSPGLQSPLAVFEELATEDPSKPPRQTWVEQVEFRVPGQILAKLPPRSASLPAKKLLPSLDQITARLSFQKHIYMPQHDAPPCHTARLPAFLKPASHTTPPRQPSPPTIVITEHKPKARPSLPAEVGRLHFPVRSSSPPAPKSLKVEIHAPSPKLPPSPCSPIPKLEIKTTVVSRTSSISPTQFTESNLRALNVTRERTAQDMLKRLRRRTLPPGAPQISEREGEDGRKIRRHSAPPELIARERSGFAKSVLDLPGAF